MPADLQGSFKYEIQLFESETWSANWESALLFWLT